MQYELVLTQGSWFQANTKLPPQALPKDRLRIASHQDGIIITTSDAITIGRDEDCDVILDSRVASRKHAILFERKGKLLITDTSSHGTTIIRLKESRAGPFKVGEEETYQITIKSNAEPQELESGDTLIFGMPNTQVMVYILGP